MAMSEFKRTDIIKGVNYFQGNIDGEAINSGSIHVEEAMSVERGTAAGSRTVGFPCLNGDIAKYLVETSKSWPITAEVTYELNVTGKTHKLVVRHVKPISTAQPQPAAQPKA